MRKRPPLSILSESRFLVTEDLFDAFAYSVINKDSLSEDLPSYSELMEEGCRILNEKVCGGDVEVNLTTDFENLDIQDNSIAYYRIEGMILADDYWWWFSSKRFDEQLKQSEANPQINAHFIHITSGGGEAWYLDKVFETLQAAAKPIVVLCEKIMGSAALYIGCTGDKIFALTQNDIVGSLGTMASMWNADGYYTNLGFKKVVVNAHKSDLKNKKYKDLQNGKPEQFITEELDPLQVQFEASVRAARATVAALPDDHPAVRGETYDAAHAIEVGFIDAIASSPEEAILACHNMGMAYKDGLNVRNTIANFFK